VLQQFPGIEEKWPVSEQGDVAKALSDAILVVCNHARRISRDKGKFAEACKNLTSFQVEKLEAIRSLVGQQKEETKDGKKPDAKSPTTPQKRKPNSKAASPATPKRRKLSAEAASPVSSVPNDWPQDILRSQLLTRLSSEKGLEKRKSS
jgi:hypothetical protein